MVLTIVMLLIGFEPFDSKPYLTPTSAPATSVWVSWNTLLPDSSILAYGLTTELEDTIRYPDTVYYHHVLISGLTPGTHYYYQVLPGGAVKSFSTSLAAADSFFFIAMGDTRTDSVAHQSVIDQMASHPAEFITHCGDLIEYGDNASFWRTFFNIEDTLLQTIPIIPAIGNHENPYWQYDTLFPLPDSEDYYSYNCANVHVVSLNTEMNLYGDQRTWLESDLAAASANPALDWIFANLHRPPYSSGSHGCQTDVQDAWCPLFETYGVDIVFCGHDHDYERTYPINGVVYIVTGGGGAPLHGVGMNSWTAYSESTFQFCLVKIKGKVLYQWAIKPDGTVFDSSIIDKTIAVHEEGFARRKNERILSLQPVPFTRVINIEYAIPDGEEGMIMILDCAGRCIEKTAVRGKGRRQRWDWLTPADDQKKFAPGVYFIVLEYGENLIVRKTVKAD